MKQNNQQRPTPETDEACWMQDWEGYRGEIVNSNFARKLERQRDEAREQLEAMREAVKEAGKIITSIQLNDIFEETMRNHATLALAKLQPFLKP